MNNEFEETWKESSVVGFKAVCQNLLRKAEGTRVRAVRSWTKF